MPHRLLIGEPINDTWVLLHQIVDSIERCEDDLFKKYSMTLQEYRVFRALIYIKGVVTPMKITKFLDKSPNYVTFLIDGMEKKGFIIRKRDLNDRRSLRLIITSKGEKQYQKISVKAEELPQKLLSVLSHEDLPGFINKLKKIREKTYEHRKLKDDDILEEPDDVSE